MYFAMDENSIEIVTATHAMVMASALCQKVKKDAIGSQSILKSDRSPVTIADYGSQAIICKFIKEKFPNDVMVAEEDSTELKKPENSKILKQVTGYVNDFISVSSSEEICSWIDPFDDPQVPPFSTGKKAPLRVNPEQAPAFRPGSRRVDLGSHSIKDRFWVLDPIDGTKGFLRGDQYAIALALIENGSIQLGLLACPNLYVDKDQPNGKRGCLFFALRKKGSFQVGMDGRHKQALSVSKVEDPQEASFTESVEPDHADHLFHQRLAQKLNILKPPLQMDSQAKYGIVARGEATLYLRVPSPSEPGYKEKIWDHAAGAIIAEEAGGKVTDISGNPLDFSCGIELVKNHGILVTNGILHNIVLKALEM
jgi:3'(2'), 5'-bisphosphate nucleotidase